MNKTKLCFTAVICSFENAGREKRLQQVIANLQRQRDITLQIVLVWKGFDRRQVPFFDGVTVIGVPFCGSSEARNIGASRASGDIICFLDDDTFPVGDDFFVRAANELDLRKLDFLTCNISSSGAVMAGQGVSADVKLVDAGLIGNMWEPGLVVRREAFAKVGFDPTLGISCVHGSSEGLDYGCRLVQAGFRGQRVAALLIDHPPLDLSDGRAEDRTFFYSLGNGSVLVQHRMYAVYFRQIAKAGGKLLLATATFDRTSLKLAFIRLMCLMLGPMLPRQSARILPRTGSGAFVGMVQVDDVAATEGTASSDVASPRAEAES
ncbi:glycosyltransferase family 2 protein [Dyella kyungheensis]|uniref:Glycosyltransferase n=1 Tax=Dyella kyungheensis TaxID=1242174 RepID=A0ABS2JV89_9GAMM|nr:glycosyltransferase family 2 protein [Dyella kyungheensis]MBM7122806.1 glycosyltransferase [Dyella kyungheensis]